MRIRTLLFSLALVGFSSSALAQDLLIKNARILPGGTGAPINGDILISGGKIKAMGGSLAGTANVIDAHGRNVTPALFAGVTDIGVEEVSGESSTVDENMQLGAHANQMTIRPEFDVTLAFNPDSVLIPIIRNEGFGWTLISAGNGGVSSIVLGQGGVVRLNGDVDATGPRVLFLAMGNSGASKSGSSRAAQWMILDQLADEAHGRIGADSQFALLTPAGRKVFLQYLNGQGRLLVNMNRASDIRQLLRWSAKHKVRIGIIGGDEAWKLAHELATAKVPVFVNALDALPNDFDALGTRMDNAALLANAGVPVSFFLDDMASHLAYKVRQIAGNAVAHGMKWEDAYAGLTTVPAQALGVDSQVGSLQVGHDADIVIWSGDPLEVNAIADNVLLRGRDIPLRSRQSELRDRYASPEPDPTKGELPRAYRNHPKQ